MMVTVSDEVQSKAHVCCQRGLAELAANNLDSALTWLEQAIDHDPECANAYAALGEIYQQKNELAEADYCLRMALRCRPDSSEILHKLARNCIALGNRPEALAILKEAKGRHLDSGAFLSQLALIYDDLDEIDLTIRTWEEVIALNPRDASAHSNLGLQWHYGKGDVDKAIACFRRALDLKPDLTEARFNLCQARADAGEVEQALAGFEPLLAEPFREEVMFHRSVVLLKNRRFEEGWRDYHLRWRYRGTQNRHFPFPNWDGQPCPGKTLLIYGEQGLGDEIMFSSCIKDVLEKSGARVVLECNLRLECLFRRSFPGVTVIGAARAQSGLERLADVAPIDFQVAIGDLPSIFRTEEAAFPDHRGYLKADPERVAFWRNRLAALGDGPKIGISWRGGQGKTRREARSIPLQEWLPILATDGMHFVSLQYTDCRTELEALSDNYGLKVLHWQEAIDDYDETAALVMALDRVVTVCTSIVHLTGALGRPGWVLVPRVPEWRYLASGQTMPWYPSVRLIRQPRSGDWTPVLHGVARQLSAGKP
ncbi:tetratricopeptide repeat protein [Methylococcus sp. Mc7]|uniref:tetratricopeptide repeat protein n=1 Tax=Methylococcus sp. Mc7 TaxID=2860258 RepID=UPI001C53281A|nr:tetratricopeptide repeat protein [Methylococcus sp. Mc7]QXP83535.1 tetratricopeptide repeat protein [Methylococcus sp. Mc7]